MANYAEPYPGARKKVTQVLQIMLTAWIAARLKDQADGMIADLE